MSDATIPMDPFHTIVTHGWAVEVNENHPRYRTTLGHYTVTMRAYEWSVGHQETRILTSFHLHGNDLDHLMELAAECAINRRKDGQGDDRTVYIKDHWL